MALEERMRSHLTIGALISILQKCEPNGVILIEPIDTEGYVVVGASVGKCLNGKDYVALNYEDQVEGD